MANSLETDSVTAEQQAEVKPMPCLHTKIPLVTSFWFSAGSSSSDSTFRESGPVSASFVPIPNLILSKQWTTLIPVAIIFQAEEFTREMEKMAVAIQSLEAENRKLREGGGGSGGEGKSAMESSESTTAETEALRARNEKLEAEIKQIKANNVRSMQKLMKELTAKDRLLKENGIAVP